MKEYDVKITEVLEKTVQVQAESREEAEGIASENWNNSMYDMDSAEDYADVSFRAGEERDISPPELLDVLLVKPGEYPKSIQIGSELEDLQNANLFEFSLDYAQNQEKIGRVAAVVGVFAARMRRNERVRLVGRAKRLVEKI